MLGRRPHPAHAKQMAMARRAAAAARRRIDCSGTLQADAARHRQTTPSPRPCRPSSRSISLSRPRHHASRPILISSSPRYPLSASSPAHCTPFAGEEHSGVPAQGAHKYHVGWAWWPRSRRPHTPKPSIWPSSLPITLNLVTLSYVTSPPGRLGLGAPRRVLYLTRKTIRRSMEHSGG